mmetsp:Transcript_38219/g.68229  ORF Transcript_38219/g.68229 Transcript_38219/m.68229 type:complete len:137 (-) Transcript_38219:198-608(-)
MFLSRDLDDLLDADGRQHIVEWEEDEGVFAHRQAAEDRYLVNAGWFGLKSGGLPSDWVMKDRIAEWCLGKGGRRAPDLSYCTDERFLSDMVWPEVSRHGMALEHSRPAVENLESKWQQFLKLPDAPVHPYQMVFWS